MGLANNVTRYVILKYLSKTHHNFIGHPMSISMCRRYKLVRDKEVKLVLILLRFLWDVSTTLDAIKNKLQLTTMLKRQNFPDTGKYVPCNNRRQNRLQHPPTNLNFFNILPVKKLCTMKLNSFLTWHINCSFKPERCFGFDVLYWDKSKI